MDAKQAHGAGGTVFELLKARLPYGAEPLEPVRPAVVSAFASYASRLPPHQQKEAVEAIAPLLRDPAENVRNAAAAALVQLRAREHASGLDRLKYGPPRVARICARDRSSVAHRSLIGRSSIARAVVGADLTGP